MQSSRHLPQVREGFSFVSAPRIRARSDYRAGMRREAVNLAFNVAH